MQFEEFSGCIAWWRSRAESERSWKVDASEFLSDGYNLDLRNPNSKLDIEHLPPERLIQDIIDKETKLLSIIQEVQSLLQAKQ